MGAAQPTTSPNFGFLAEHEPMLVALGAQAELLFTVDPAASIAKIRLFSELLAQEAAARCAVYTTREEPQLDRLRRLRERSIFTADVEQAFHTIRKAGNAAAHDNAGDASEALTQLRLARSLGVWFHRTFSRQRTFSPPPFAIPRPPEDATARLRAELETLKAALASAHASAGSAAQAAEDARRAALEAHEARLAAEGKARLEAHEREAAEQLLAEAAANEAALADRLARLQAASAASPARAAALVETAASVELDLDEATTRRLIDERLRAAGWEADSEKLHFATGARPQKGRNLAIAEWPTDAGPADYVLFAGLTPLAVVEAKRASKNVAAVLGQSARYARGLTTTEGVTLAGPSNGTWPDAERAPFRVPFLFATNGRPYLKQLAEVSGVWFRDARRPENHGKPLPDWYTPEGLTGLLKRDLAAAHAKLAAEPVDYLGLRRYQLRAIHAAEDAITRGAPTALLAMATGTGKTKTCIGLCYRLLKAQRFRRILFLVDRSALAEQTENAFKETRLESLQTFSSIFDVKGPLSPEIAESDCKVQIATVQSLVRRVLYADEPLPVDAYDCIVVDECHRGYTLDRELSDGELLFRDEADFISKYRRVLEHFDAVKVALTATPAVHTREIFGDPVFTYSYREAVVDGYLVDHPPPTQIVTALAEDGITFQVGESVAVYQPRTRTTQLSLLPDEVHLEIDQFHRRVITEPFNTIVCGELAREIDPSLPGKTLVFCVNDLHADLVVRLLKAAFAQRYGTIEDGAVEKITGSVDKPLQAVRRFKNERLPSVVVTVDLLTTGIDVPAIDRLVFLRRVRSRILYDQMLGRATRLCPDLYGPGQHKEIFRIYDAVGLYAALSELTDMKPVVVDPSIPFAKLVADLLALTDEALQREVLGQLVTKLDRKRRRLDARVTELLEHEAGRDPGQLVDWLREAPVADARAFFAERPRVAELLDARQPGKGLDGLLISSHPDALRRVEQGYGPGQQRPEDYLDAFARYVREHLNDLPALVVVTQRPRELTRAQLKELRLALDRAGYPESHLRAAWAQRTNHDIAAGIIGHIRQAALGDALVPYEDRVARATKKLLASRPFTDPQRKWLERIGKQLQKEVVVDRASIDAEGSAFAAHGGFKHLDKVFEGKLETILGDLAEEVWKVGA
jgi:type I restriction enzyme R subunit